MHHFVTSLLLRLTLVFYAHQYGYIFSFLCATIVFFLFEGKYEIVHKYCWKLIVLAFVLILFVHDDLILKIAHSISILCKSVSCFLLH